MPRFPDAELCNPSRSERRALPRAASYLVRRLWPIRPGSMPTRWRQRFPASCSHKLFRTSPADRTLVLGGGECYVACIAGSFVHIRCFVVYSSKQPRSKRNPSWMCVEGMAPYPSMSPAGGLSLLANDGFMANSDSGWNATPSSAARRAIAAIWSADIFRARAVT